MYSKHVRFDIADTVGDRSASVAANLRRPLWPQDVVRIADYSNTIPGNTEEDFQWRKYEVKKIVGEEYDLLLYDDAATLQTYHTIFGAHQAALAIPGGPGHIGSVRPLGGLTMIQSEFRFQTPSGAGRNLQKIVIPDCQTTQLTWQGGFMPTMIYRVFIVKLSTETLDTIAENELLYDEYSPTDISVDDILVTPAAGSTVPGIISLGWPTKRIEIPTTAFTLDASSSYAIFFVPRGVINAVGFDITMETASWASGGTTNYSHGATVGLIDGGSYYIPSTVESGELSTDQPMITLDVGDLLYYIDLDENGERLPIPNISDAADQNILSITTHTSQGSGTVDTPLPFVFPLRFDTYNPGGKGAATVELFDVNGAIFPPYSYKVVWDLTSSRETSVEAMRGWIYMSDLVANENTLPMVSYERILDGVVQRNFKELVDPQPVGKYTTDYTYDFTEDVPRVFFTQAGGLSMAVEGQFVWARKSSTTVVKPMMPIGTPWGSWYPRISNGSFLHRDQDTAYGKKDLTYQTSIGIETAVAMNLAKTSYGVPAAGGSPYVTLAIREEVEIVDDYTIRFQRRPIYFWDGDWGVNGVNPGDFTVGDGTYPDYIVPNIIDPPDVTGDVTDVQMSHGINIYVNNVLMDNSNIDGWNKLAGVVTLQSPLKEGDTVKATYLFETRYVPILADINPTEAHLNSDKVGDAIRVVLRPAWDTYYDDTGEVPTTRLAWHWLSENDTGVYDYDFGTSTGTTGYIWYDESTELTLPPGTIVLADYFIGSVAPDPQAIVDTRVVGGGIKADEWFSKVQKGTWWREAPMAREIVQPESRYYWDIGSMDGEVYQGDGTIVVSVPSSLVTTFMNRVKALAAAQSKLSPSERDAADAAIAANTTTTYLASLSGDTLQKIKMYISTAQNAKARALALIRARIEKHAAAGTMVVLVDETDMIYSASSPSNRPAINRTLRPSDPSEPIGERPSFSGTLRPGVPGPPVVETPTIGYTPPPDKVMQL